MKSAIRLSLTISTALFLHVILTPKQVLSQQPSSYQIHPYNYNGCKVDSFIPLEDDKVIDICLERREKEKRKRLENGFDAVKKIRFAKEQANKQKIRTKILLEREKLQHDSE